MSEKKKDEEDIYSKYILNKKGGCGKNRKNEEILYSATELNEKNGNKHFVWLHKYKFVAISSHDVGSCNLTFFETK